MAENQTESGVVTDVGTEAAGAPGGTSVEHSVPGEAADTSVEHSVSDEATDKSVGHGGDRNYRKVRSGIVVSDKMDKTIVVQVEDRVKHALYGKVMRRSERLKAHDENNDAGVGDRVRLMETRPLSATKRWRLVSIIEKAR